jgi:hypothetical protein
MDLAKDKAAAEAFQTGLKNLFDKSYLSAKKNFEEAGKAFPKESFIKERLDVAKRASEEEAKVKAETGPAPAAAAAAADPKKAGAPAKTAAGAPVKPAAAPVKEPAEEDSSAPAEEEKSNMPLYLIAGAAALLLIGLLVKALGKKKGGDDD